MCALTYRGREKGKERARRGQGIVCVGGTTGIVEGETRQAKKSKKTKTFHFKAEKCP